MTSVEEWGVVYNDFQGHWEIIAADGRTIIDEIGEFRFADNKSREAAAKRLALSIRDNHNASLAHATASSPSVTPEEKQ